MLLRICSAHPRMFRKTDGFFLRTVSTYTEKFLRVLMLCSKSRSLQGLLESKAKISSNHAFFRYDQASVWNEKNALHSYIFLKLFRIIVT